MNDSHDNIVELEIAKLNLSGKSLELIKFLVKTKEELVEFLSKFWNNSRQFFCIAEYRLYRIIVRNLTFEELSDKVQVDLKTGFEDLFMHSITTDEIQLYEELEKSNDIDLSYVYLIQKDNPHKMFSRIVLRV